MMTVPNRAGDRRAERPGTIMRCTRRGARQKIDRGSPLTLSRAPTAPPDRCAATARLLDQTVELAGVLAGDLVRRLGRQVAELLGDVLRGLRPHAVGVRIVGAPHERLDAHLLDQLAADAIELERPLALAPPVVARLHREAEIAEAILPLEVHAVERVRNP